MPIADNAWINIKRSWAQSFKLDPFIEQGSCQANHQHMYHSGQRFSLIMQQQNSHQHVPEHTITKAAGQFKYIAQLQVTAQIIA
jgi:hypothetical protein